MPYQRMRDEAKVRINFIVIFSLYLLILIGNHEINIRT